MKCSLIGKRFPCRRWTRATRQTLHLALYSVLWLQDGALTDRTRTHTHTHTLEGWGSLYCLCKYWAHLILCPPTLSWVMKTTALCLSDALFKSGINFPVAMSWNKQTDIKKSQWVIIKLHNLNRKEEHSQRGKQPQIISSCKGSIVWIWGGKKILGNWHTLKHRLRPPKAEFEGRMT